MDRGFRQSFAPVRVGDEVDVEIESVGEKGDGIAKIKGFVCRCGKKLEIRKKLKTQVYMVCKSCNEELKIRIEDYSKIKNE